MKTQLIIKLFLANCFVAVILSCAAKPKVVELTTSDLEHSRIEIAYVLGHNQYLLKLKSEDKKQEIANFMNEARLEFRSLTPEEFLNFAKKVRQTALTYQAHSAPVTESCKAPFKILIKTQKRESLTEGCRSEDSRGGFGRLIREAEILFYSQKSPSEEGAF